MTGITPPIFGPGGELHPQLDDASLEARERLYRVASRNPYHGEITPCSLQPPGTVEYMPPQPEGTPAMNQTEPAEEPCKDEGTFPALLNELEELNSELQCELQCLDGAVDRLAGSQAQGCEETKAEVVPSTHLARLHHQLIRLRNLRDETRELNRRLAEAV